MSLLSGSELFAKGTAGDDDAGGVLRADRALGVRPSSSTANGDATTGALRADSISQVRPSSEPPIHPADQRSTISSGRPDRARTGVDTAQPFVGDATRSTIQNASGLKHGEQTRRKKQTNSDAEQQHPTTRTTRHDPVDGIDTS